MQVLLIAIALLAAASGAIGAEPYDLRGAKLGMTLSEFRKLSHPDGVKGARLFCGDEKVNTGPSGYIKRSDEERSQGRIQCTWFGPVEGRYRSMIGQQVGPVHVPSGALFYTFYEAKLGAEPLLASFSFEMDNRKFDGLVQALSEKWGEPFKREVSSVTNRMGAAFDNVDVTWMNDVSAIVVKKRHDKIDTMRVHYFHTQLADEMLARVRAANRSAADKL